MDAERATARDRNHDPIDPERARDARSQFIALFQSLRVRVQESAVLSAAVRSHSPPKIPTNRRDASDRPEERDQCDLPSRCGSILPFLSQDVIDGDLDVLGAEADDSVTPFQTTQSTSAQLRSPRSALGISIALGMERLAETLLAFGADPDVRPDQNLAPIHLAVLAAARDPVEGKEAPSANIRARMVDLLAEAGADLDAPSPSESMDGMRAIHLACERGDELVIRALLRHGADLRRGISPEFPVELFCGRLCGDLPPGVETELVDHLLSGVDEQHRPDAAQSSFVRAAGAGRSHLCARIAASFQVNPCGLDSMGVPAFVLALAHRNVSLSSLAKMGVHPGARCSSGFNALFWAVSENKFDALAELLELGLDVTQPVCTDPTSGFEMDGIRFCSHYGDPQASAVVNAWLARQAVSGVIESAQASGLA